MMKTAKLFINGFEQYDIYYHESSIESCVNVSLNNMCLVEFNQDEEFEWHLENESGDIVISGMATVNYTPSVTIKVNDD